MSDIVIRPSMKYIKAGYVITVLVVITAVFLSYRYIDYKYLSPEQSRWIPWIWLVLLLWPIKRHIQRQAIKLTISGEKLHFETGIASKSMRIIQLPKVQDVRVLQTLGQRILDVGDISIETAGESSRLVVENLDHPRRLAEQITDASSHTASSGGLH